MYINFKRGQKNLLKLKKNAVQIESPMVSSDILFIMCNHLLFLLKRTKIQESAEKFCKNKSLNYLEYLLFLTFSKISQIILLIFYF